MCTPMLKMQRLIDAKCLVKLTNEKKNSLSLNECWFKEKVSNHIFTHQAINIRRLIYCINEIVILIVGKKKL